jgi:hypothetical protein
MTFAFQIRRQLPKLRGSAAWSGVSHAKQVKHLPDPLEVPEINFGNVVCVCVLCVCFLKGFVMKSFVLSVVLALAGSVANAQTAFPVRVVEAGQSITVTKGDYTLNQPVVVRFGGTLVVEAGSTLEVAPIGVPFQVWGNLRMAGSAAEPITVKPIGSGVVGQIATYSTLQRRPSVELRYVEMTTTRSTNYEVLYLDRCDFAIEGCKLSISQGIANRSVLRVVNGSAGSIASSLLDGQSDLDGAASVGVTIGATAGAVQFNEVLISNATTPVKVDKQFALVSGSVE